MRESSTQISMQQKRGRPKKDNGYNKTITMNTFKRERHTRHKAGKLCVDLEMFHKHVLTKVNVRKPKAREVCGIDSYTTCGICKAPAYYFSKKGGQKSQIASLTFTVITYLG